MLSEEQKAAIKKEETYRTEIRNSLENRRSKLFNIVNAPLTIFFLSSILVTLVSWSLTAWDENKINIQEVSLLEEEIKHRLQYINVISNDNWQKKLNSAYKASRGIDREWLQVKYKKYPLVALVFILEKKVKDNQISKYKKFRKDIEEWQKLLGTVRIQQEDSSQTAKDKRESFIKLSKKLFFPNK